METRGETTVQRGNGKGILPPRPALFGVLNITTDSFSDGGKYLDSGLALDKARSLIAEGADVIDIGAQSSNTAAGLVDPDLEWARMESLIRALKKEGIPISIDSFKPSVIRRALDSGVDYINHIKGFTDPEGLELVRSASDKSVKFIAMYSQDHGDKANENSPLTPETVIEKVLEFFRERRRVFAEYGISEDRLILDPGMGFFLSPDYRVSFSVISSVKDVLSEFPNLMVSVTKKSFLGNGLGGLSVEEREIPTAVSELFLWLQGVPFLRTHSPRSFLKAMRTWELSNGKY